MNNYDDKSIAFDDIDLQRILVAVQYRMTKLKDAMYHAQQFHPFKDDEWRELNKEWEDLNFVENRTKAQLKLMQNDAEMVG